MDLIHKHNDQVGYGLSYDLWRNFPVHEILALQDRNVGIGFFDDFLRFDPTTLTGGYLILKGTGCGVAQIADVANGFGLVKLSLDGNAAADEAVLQWGCGLSAPFKLANNDLCFEARLKVSAITAAKWSIGIGLGEVGMGATDCLFVDTTYALADKNFCGFNHLVAEGAAWDGAFKADGQTYQNGATKTKLDTLKTAVADTFFKLGMRFKADSNTLHWYVDGAEKASAKLTKTEMTAATFPDDVFVTPIIGAKDGAGDAALDVTLDWWACAQTV